jgi:hypothetical protein
MRESEREKTACKRNTDTGSKSTFKGEQSNYRGRAHTHMKESEATRVGAHNSQDSYFTFTFSLQEVSWRLKEESQTGSGHTHT